MNDFLPISGRLFVLNAIILFLIRTRLRQDCECLIVSRHYFHRKDIDLIELKIYLLYEGMVFYVAGQSLPEI